MVTLEHGIGCPLAGVTQVPLRPEKGQTYAGMLREALLHNPDVVALEEAPDRETVSLALHAAAAGRLVLSTVYAADGVACLYTLLRMGISPLLVARTVTLILAQYRLKRLCSKCKTSTYPTEGMLNRLSGLSAGRIPAMWYFGAGCEACGMTGFHGQVTIYEALPVTPSLQQAILDDATHEQLRRAAEQTGYATLLDAGLENVAQGLTSLEEVLRLPVGH
jgi:type II secretory ATPase GspE/PulE/Tfp pilus assembly ATPase PilB-like protein